MQHVKFWCGNVFDGVQSPNAFDGLGVRIVLEHVKHDKAI